MAHFLWMCAFGVLLAQRFRFGILIPTIIVLTIFAVLFAPPSDFMSQLFMHLRQVIGVQIGFLIGVAIKTYSISTNLPPPTGAPELAHGKNSTKPNAGLSSK